MKPEKSLPERINEFLLEISGKIPYEKRKIKGAYLRIEAASALQEELQKELDKEPNNGRS